MRWLGPGEGVWKRFAFIPHCCRECGAWFWLEMAWKEAHFHSKSGNRYVNWYCADHEKEAKE
jgi:hypothetical protein